MRWGDGKLEVVALRDEIFSHLKDGLPVSRIYRKLLEDRRIQVSSRQFYRLVDQLRQSATARSITSVPSSKNQLPSTIKPVGPSGGIPPRKEWDADSADVDDLLNGHKKET
jgi:hypothetical protein